MWIFKELFFNTQKYVFQMKSTLTFRERWLVICNYYCSFREMLNRQQSTTDGIFPKVVDAPDGCIIGKATLVLQLLP